MGFTKPVGIVTGAVLAIAVTAAVVITQGGNEPAPKRPAASVAESPSNTGTDQASTASTTPAVAAPAAPAASPATTTKPAAATAAPAAPSASAPTAPAPNASAQEVVNSVTALTEQLRQAANSGGQPRPLTQEEVNAALQDQLAKLGIKL